MQSMIVEKNHDMHIPLEKELFDKLEALKEYYGIKNSTEIIRFLITKEYRKITRSWYIHLELTKDSIFIASLQ